MVTTRGPTRQCIITRLLLLYSSLLWLSISSITAASSTNTFASFADAVRVLDLPVVIHNKEAAPVSDAALERAAYVRTVLKQRLYHVSSGQRMRDIVRWIQKHNHGQTAIFSSHGADPSNNDADSVVGVNRMDLAILEELHHSEEETSVEEVISSKDPFSKNRFHLGLVCPPDAPPNQFPGPALHVLDDRKPNAVQLALRALKLGVHFAPVMSTVGLAMISTSFRQSIWYKWVASCIGNSGAAWIKWGQWSSTRNDMFPDALCRELSTLHADAPAHGAAFSESQLESSLGLAPNTLRHVFDSFDPEPLASGSIAQVHKAELDGKLLAIKVRHPNVARLIDMDFRLMSLAARFLDYVPGLQWLHIRDSVEQFSSTMAAQAHLHVEAYHLEILNYNFRKWKPIRFPEPFFASSSVIIETFEPGVVFSKLIDRFAEKAKEINQEQGIMVAGGDPKVEEPDGHDVEKSSCSSPTAMSSLRPLNGYDIFPFSVSKFIVTLGLNMYLKMLLIDNLMHADLHPVSTEVLLESGILICTVTLTK